MPSGSKFRIVRIVSRVLLPFALLGMALSAQAQSFSLQMSVFTTDAVNPGGTDTASLVLSPLNGFNSTVALTCVITPAPPNGNQGCQVSPETVTPPTGASVTIATAYSGGTWQPGSYTVTITGTAGTETETASGTFAVLNVTPAFNILVPAPLAPASVPAGNPASGTIDINPINGYTGQVTLSCSNLTPLVISPPVCSFNPPTVNVAGTLATSIITITTTGPLQLVAVPRGRSVYALWLFLPLLTLAGLGAVAGGKRAAKMGGMIAVVLVTGCLLLLPACGNTTVTGTPSTGTGRVTPNNTYTFTVTGVDQDGFTSTNSGTSSKSTVTLTVTTPIVP
ncbi:MAG: hypothetical protein WAN03_12260 [Candidatus Sulfotelmatobacter sp.]